MLWKIFTYYWVTLTLVKITLCPWDALNGFGELANLIYGEPEPGTIIPQERIKLIGCGWGRTGTASINLALEELGYRVYHVPKIVQHDHFDLWTKAIDNPAEHLDEALEKILLLGYNATLAMQTSALCLEIRERFPESQVLLTIREPHKWVKSFNTIFTTITPFIEPKFPFNLFTKAGKLPKLMLRTLASLGLELQLNYNELAGHFPWLRKYNSVEMRPGAEEKFEDWIDHVKKAVPNDKLLVYSVKQGWDPLTDFLGLPRKEFAHFPHANKSEHLKVLHKVLNAVQFWWPMFIMANLGVQACIFYYCARNWGEKKKKME